MSEEPPTWRVTMWFLDNAFGWTCIAFAFMEAADGDHALARASQRTAKLGFSANRDTIIKVEQETGQKL